MFSGKIFRSRWAALLWAAGIVWTAYDVAEANAPKHAAAAPQAQATDATGAAVSDADMKVLKSLLDGQ